MPTAVQVAGLDPEGGGIHVGSCCASRGTHQGPSTRQTPVGCSTGPAHRAGIQPNDLLVAADDQLAARRFLETWGNSMTLMTFESQTWVIQ